MNRFLGTVAGDQLADVIVDRLNSLLSQLHRLFKRLLQMVPGLRSDPPHVRVMISSKKVQVMGGLIKGRVKMGDESVQLRISDQGQPALLNERFDFDMVTRGR